MKLWKDGAGFSFRVSSLKKSKNFRIGKFCLLKQTLTSFRKGKMRKEKRKNQRNTYSKRGREMSREREDERETHTDS